MNTLKELDRIVLTAAIPEEGLEAGDVGTIVHIYRQAAAYEVEFLTLDGDTAALATVLPGQLRAATGQDVTHARTIAAGAGEAQRNIIASRGLGLPRG